MKTKEELDAIREDCKNLKSKLSQLTEDELKEVSGGISIPGLEEPLLSTIFSCSGMFKCRFCGEEFSSWRDNEEHERYCVQNPNRDNRWGI